MPPAENPGSPATVSICIPTYNRAQGLQRALSSVAAQDYPRLEVIVLDNASTDDTADVAAQFAGRIDGLRYQRNPQNIGATNNFRAAMALATSDYAMWLADDDWLDPDYVSRCMARFAKDSALALVSGINRVHGENGARGRGQRINLTGNSATARLLGYYALVGDNSIFYGIHRRENLVELPLRDVLGGDWFFIAATAWRGKLATCSETELHRSEGGASGDLSRLAKNLGLGALYQRQPYLAVAAGAARQIIEDDATFGNASGLYRRILAGLVYLGIVVKKVILQGIYRLLRGAF